MKATLVIRPWLISLTLIFALTLTGCGGKAAAPPAPATSAMTTVESSACGGEPYRIAEGELRRASSVFIQLIRQVQARQSMGTDADDIRVDIRELDEMHATLDRLKPPACLDAAGINRVRYSWHSFKDSLRNDEFARDLARHGQKR